MTNFQNIIKKAKTAQSKWMPIQQKWQQENILNVTLVKDVVQS